MTKDEWWEKYNSEELCDYHNEQFDEWWDPDLFNWKYSINLSKNCYKYFED